MAVLTVAKAARLEILAETSHETPLGRLGAEWTVAGLYRIGWDPIAGQDNAAIGSLEDSVIGDSLRTFGASLGAYLAGDLDALDAVPVDPAGWTPFLADVYRFCRAIPAGQTLTYGELAARAGRPGAARAVGRAMATNRVMWVIPCHRVLGSGGRLHGYGGPGGLDMKRWLLDHEGAAYVSAK